MCAGKELGRPPAHYEPRYVLGVHHAQARPTDSGGYREHPLSGLPAQRHQTGE